MNDLRLFLKGNQTAFLPGATVEGALDWNLSGAAKALEVRLIWFTRGKGTPDVSIVDSSRVEAPGPSGELPFRFLLPPAPHSFSGKLISLLWAVEAIVYPSKEAARVQFVMAPAGREIVLPQLEKVLSPLEQKFLQRKADYQARRGLKSDDDEPLDSGGFTTHR